MLDFLKKLLQKQKQHNVPLIHEMIERSKTETDYLEQWQAGKHKIYMMDFILQQLKEGNGAGITVVNTPKSRGFVLEYNPKQANKGEFSSMFDYFKQQTLALNYKTYMSDVKQRTKSDHVETIERHYLKPRLNFQELTKDSIIDQLYGNIIIEHYLKNEQPISIKFWAQPYTDHKYTDALPFQELAEKVFI